jgi:hypothetical protein
MKRAHVWIILRVLILSISLYQVYPNLVLALSDLFRLIESTVWNLNFIPLHSLLKLIYWVSNRAFIFKHSIDFLHLLIFSHFITCYNGWHLVLSQCIIKRDWVKKLRDNLILEGFFFFILSGILKLCICTLVVFIIFLAFSNNFLFLFFRVPFIR